MKIVYLGNTDPATTTRQMADALVRCGHEVLLRDPEDDLGLKRLGRVASALHYRSGYRLMQPAVLRWTEGLDLPALAPDVVWVDSGEWFGPQVLRALRRAGAPVVLFNHDDPTGPRDGRRFDSLRQALPGYDLFATTVRDAVTDAEFREHGVRRWLRLTAGHDEVVHRPFEDPAAIAPELRSSVAFVGTWIPVERRDAFVGRLLELGVPVSIWGNHWQKAPLAARIGAHWRGPALRGRDYVAAIQAADVTLGMLSSANRDVHTRRSSEVPYAGGLLCAQRTRLHESLYRDGEEAVFWSDADECAALCLKLLADDARRERIRAAGMRRVRANRVGNEDIVRRVLDTLLHGAAAGVPEQALAGAR